MFVVGRIAPWRRLNVHALTMSTSVSNSKARIALCQIAVGSDKAVNINRAKRAIEDAVLNGNGIDIAVLPEVWNSPYSTSSFPIYAGILYFFKCTQC